MKIRKLSLIGLSSSILTLCLSACNTLMYQEPASGDRARVRFLNVADAQTIVRSYEQTNCGGNEQEWMRLQNKFLFNSAPKSLDMPLQEAQWHKNSFKEVFVAAGSMHGMMVGANSYIPRFDGIPRTDQFVQTLQYSYPVYAGTIMYYQQVSQMTCGVPFDFDFETNKDYELRYDQQGMSCNITVYELMSAASSASRWQRVERAKFDNNLQPNNKDCKVYFNKSRLN